MKLDIKSMPLTEIARYFETAGEKAYRAEQVFRWLHKGALSFDEMTNLPQSLRAKLDDCFFITVPNMLIKMKSKLDGTAKYLWGLADGNTIESVLMEYEHGLTVCLSTQAGCRMGCTFCASTIGGLSRNLAPSEMLDQVLFAGLDAGRRISNVTLMGIGEPLDNLENVKAFLSLINHSLGLNIGARHITISTCGIIENIDKLAQYDIQFTLAVSLHAPDDETRTRLMPINKAGSIEELLSACKRYFDATGRRVTYEYALIDGVNDTPRHAEMLAKRLNDTGSHINLILLNNVPESPFRASPYEKVKTFSGVLQKKAAKFTIRRRLGADIEASCGQLRRGAGNRK